MIFNPFFSPDIRLQSERGHRLITGGPTSLRHPGYLPCWFPRPLALAIGSWLSSFRQRHALVILKAIRERDFSMRSRWYNDYMRQVEVAFLDRGPLSFASAFVRDEV
jgi:hypothetical protein